MLQRRMSNGGVVLVPGFSAPQSTGGAWPASQCLCPSSGAPAQLSDTPAALVDVGPTNINYKLVPCPCDSPGARPRGRGRFDAGRSPYALGSSNVPAGSVAAAPAATVTTPAATTDTAPTTSGGIGDWISNNLLLVGALAVGAFLVFKGGR